MKSQEEILRKTEAFVEEQLAGEASGHDADISALLAL